jgi:hypothetical protein
LDSEHCWHEPLGWQAGVAPLPHSASAPHARQVCVGRSQTGVVPPHWAFDVHGTQVAVAASQTGVAPEHRVALVAEHAPHAPPGWQAGVAPPHSPSPAQPRHMCVAWLQMGVAPPHWVFDVQDTHTPAGV